MRRVMMVLVLACATATLWAQQNRIDTITPSAPELASYGALNIGVRTIQVTDKKRPDILYTKEGGPVAEYDRTLTLEVWYPAALAAGQQPGGEYRVITRDPAITATILGKAVRDAAPLAGPGAPKPGDGGYPLVIISHGYPGNRYLMSHIGENLASKGFVTVSIDHKDSTYDDQKAFGSTLYNRSFDQLFVLNEIDRMSKAGSGSFLAGLVDASRTGIVGYSMGGYGVVNVIGGGFSDGQRNVWRTGAAASSLLAERGGGRIRQYRKSAWIRASRPPSRSARGACRAASGISRPEGHSHAGAVRGRQRGMMCRGTREERARSTRVPSTPIATCSRSSTRTTTPPRPCRRRSRPTDRPAVPLHPASHTTPMPCGTPRG